MLRRGRSETEAEREGSFFTVLLARLIIRLTEFLTAREKSDGIKRAPSEISIAVIFCPRGNIIILTGHGRARDDFALFFPRDTASAKNSWLQFSARKIREPNAGIAGM